MPTRQSASPTNSQCGYFGLLAGGGPVVVLAPLDGPDASKAQLQPVELLRDIDERLTSENMKRRFVTETASGMAL